MLVKQRIIVSLLIPWVNLNSKFSSQGIISRPIAMDIGHGDPGGKEMDIQNEAPM
jgi:hypothetical protein